MSKGSIILLNGASSVGKTTLARTIQEVCPTPVQHISLDQFRDGMSGRYRGMNSRDDEPGSRGLNVVPVDGLTQLRFGDVGRLTLRGMRRAAAAFAATGIDVVIDDLLLEMDFLRDYLEVFNGFDVTFTGVYCDLKTLRDREQLREGARGMRIRSRGGHRRTLTPGVCRAHLRRFTKSSKPFRLRTHAGRGAQCLRRLPRQPFNPIAGPNSTRSER